MANAHGYTPNPELPDAGFCAYDWWKDPIEPGVRHAKVDFFGVPHNLTAIRVDERNDDQRALGDTHKRYDDVQRAAGGPGYLSSVQIPGLEGDYVLIVTPFVD